MRIDIAGPRVELKMITVIPVPATLTLRALAAAPEKIDADSGDFPFLGPIPGSTLKGGQIDPDPFWISPKEGPSEIVAPGSIRRAYSYADGLSNLMFLTVYHSALNIAALIEVPAGADRSTTFSSEKELAKLIADWPVSRLIDA